MGELKPGWTRVKFGDVVRQVKDKVDPTTAGVERVVRGEHMDTDELRIRRWEEVGDDYLGPAFHMRFQPGQVLYGSRRTYLRKVALADFEGITANTTFVVETKDPATLLPDILPFIMTTESFHDHSIKQSKGSVNPYVNFSDLAWYEFALPPLEEQRRIQSLLQRSALVVDAHYEVAESARHVLRSLGKQFFITNPDGTNCTIADVATVRNGTTPRRARPDYWNGDVPWLPTGKVNDRVITAADEYITAAALKECSLSVIPAGSTLIAMIGQGKTRGMAARLTIDATINQNFASVTPGPDVDPLFLFYQLEAKYEALRYWSQGTNQQALNCRLVSEFPFWRPSRARQLEVRDLLADAEQALSIAEARLAAARSQQQTCLAESLRGVVQ